MYGPPFNENYPTLADQAVAKGKAIYSGTYGSSGVGVIDTDPKNQWARQLAKQPDASTFSQQGLSDDAANQQLNKIQSVGVLPNDSNPTANNHETIFLNKYIVDNGLVPQNEKVFAANLGNIQAQQPGDMNPRGVLATPTMKFPGSGGVKVG
jgi:hypothetical protein